LPHFGREDAESLENWFFVLLSVHLWAFFVVFMIGVFENGEEVLRS